MDINQRVDQVESTLVDGLQKLDRVAEHIRQILTLTVSLDRKTEIAAQAMVSLLDKEMYQPEVAAQMDGLARQFVDLMQNQQALISLLQARFDEAS
jgi:hypothetical protein